MIYYLATKENHRPFLDYIDSWGSSIQDSIRPISYDDIFRKHNLYAGCYIFADIERLNPRQAEQAADVWNQLSSYKNDVILLNHPTISKRRYSLLRQLYEKGFNKFNVYRLTEARLPTQYPVFLRKENDHKGAQSKLLKTEKELVAEMDAMNHAGLSHEDAIITEFFDTVSSDSIYRKYSAFRVGNNIIPRHIFFSKDWIVKSMDIIENNLVEEEWQYVNSNPHKDQIEDVFKLANIDYGRIDYSMLDDHIQVWEINTNPTIGSFLGGDTPERKRTNEYFSQQFNNALAEYSDIVTVKKSLNIKLNNKNNTRKLRKLIKKYTHCILKAFGLLKHEKNIHNYFQSIKKFVSR